MFLSVTKGELRRRRRKFWLFEVYERENGRFWKEILGKVQEANGAIVVVKGHIVPVHLKPTRFPKAGVAGGGDSHAACSEGALDESSA